MKYIAVKQHHQPGRPKPDGPNAIAPGTLKQARFIISREIELLKKFPASPSRLVTEVQHAGNYTIVYFRDGSRTEYWVSYIGNGLQLVGDEKER